MSPPHDHDLNPIAERVIGVISTSATAVRLHTEASPRLWPWLIEYVVAWHNGTIGSTGSSSADENITPYQRFTLRPPKVMDLAAFGCRCVALKPPEHQHKPSLSSRGWQGSFLGRSRTSRGGYDVLVGNQVVTSSSVLVDEERFDWAPPEKKHQPLTPASLAPRQLQHAPLGRETGAPALDEREPRLLNVFSGTYGRAGGLTASARSLGWTVDDISSDGETGGGWQHDLLNDATYASLLAHAAAGDYDALMLAFPCSTFSASRFYDATSGLLRGSPSAASETGGPPVVRTRTHPDGLPNADALHPRHVTEVRTANLLLERAVNIAIAARHSSSRAMLVFESPSDRSERGSTAYLPELASHGSVFATAAFARLRAEVDLNLSCTFACCRLGAPYQRYSTLFYTPEAATVLGALGTAAYQCNHAPGTHTRRAGIRRVDGSYVSADAAPYPSALSSFLARAFTFGRTGSVDPVRSPASARSSVASSACPRASTCTTPTRWRCTFAECGSPSRWQPPSSSTSSIASAVPSPSAMPNSSARATSRRARRNLPRWERSRRAPPTSWRPPSAPSLSRPGKCSSRSHAASVPRSSKTPR